MTLVYGLPALGLFCVHGACGGMPLLMNDPLLAWRKEFPILGHTTYMISHSLGAMPRRVVRAPAGVRRYLGDARHSRLGRRLVGHAGHRRRPDRLHHRRGARRSGDAPECLDLPVDRGLVLRLARAAQ